MNRAFVRILGWVGSLALLAPAAGLVRAEEIPAEYQKAIDRGLEWLAKQQYRDGHWEARGGQYPVSMTALGGMALLMEGSTLREGKYRENIRRAVDWLMARSMPNGLIGNPSNPSEASRYMYGHGYSMLFLSNVVGEEEEGERRRKLVDILEKAALFTRNAQTNRGGWGYVSARDGAGFDEGSVTITQVQALRAARNAGVVVPKEAIEMAQKYLKDSTNAEGGVIYSLASGGGGSARPALTAAAISCGFASGDYNSPLVKKWFQFCKQRIPYLSGTRMGHDEYTHYYYAQALYVLGDAGWAKLYPEAKGDDGLTWSKYRKATFPYLVRTQNSDGSWSGGHVGEVFITAVHLSILQLDKGTLPIYQR
jgi:hypothetical protein